MLDHTDRSRGHQCRAGSLQCVPAQCRSRHIPLVEHQDPGNQPDRDQFWPAGDLCSGYRDEDIELKTLVHVNQHVIRKNSKTGEREPVLTVKTSRSNTYAHEVRIDGPCVIKYSPDRPLSCGAKVWIETENDVIIIR